MKIFFQYKALRILPLQDLRKYKISRAKAVTRAAKYMSYLTLVRQSYCKDNDMVVFTIHTSAPLKPDW